MPAYSKIFSWKGKQNDSNKKIASYKKIQKSIFFKYKENRMTRYNGLCAVVKKQKPSLLHHCREFGLVSQQIKNDFLLTAGIRRNISW